MRQTFSARRFLAPSNSRSQDVSNSSRKQIRPFNVLQMSKLKEEACQRLKKNQVRNQRSIAENNLDTFNELNASAQLRADSYSPEPESTYENYILNSPGTPNASFDVEDDWIDKEKEELEVFLDAKDAYRKAFYKRDRRKRHNKILVDQARWKEQLSEMTDGWIDYCYQRQPQQQFEGEMERFELTTVNDLFSMDGNDSLKRVERREQSDDGVPGRVKERPDDREGGGDYFLSVEEVDAWERTNWKNLPGYEEPEPEGMKRTPCEEKWDNMKAGHISKEKELFKETGIFAAACRHSFVLWVVDMIKSGEGRKLALAVMNRFLQASRRERQEKDLPPLNSDQGWAYDIGCQFRETLRRSPLKSLSVEERVRILIGILHGYGHNRLCQLEFLLLYIVGVGLEDLETLERLFSVTNSLAPATRHASTFHRRQMISQFLYHHDNFEAYGNLSKFIHDNYRQSLEVQRANANVLDDLKAVGVQSGDDVYSWIKEERQYLESRHETPEDNTNVIELYKKLVLLKECRARISAGRSVFINYMENNAKSTLDLERTVRQAQETELTLLGEIHFHEARLKIDKRWEEGSEDWNRAKAMAEMKEYQGAVDKLEALVVARIFELSKMHMAGTGYKMRQHLGKALKTRSAAIKTAVQKVNQAGARLTPLREPLDYDTIIDKTYLANLDFLRETRNDVREKIWAKPHVCELTASYFKLWKSHVELDHLHVEIKRLVTYMKEERNFLKARELQVSHYDPHLAHQITIYRWERGRFNDLHRTRLRNIYKLQGFKHENIKFFIPSTGLKRQSDEDWEEVEDNLSKERPEEDGNWEDDNDEDNDDDDDESAAVDAIATVLGVAYDSVS
ncbi:hypothetical protein AAF712_015322 [Marasmius tenuissimus]|uniref:Uncharacterized protein n=1 Tax=Marasmius tenuissimus TaxID=585030 RepID=A0ABR2Z9J4_9AGAR